MRVYERHVFSSLLYAFVYFRQFTLCAYGGTFEFFPGTSRVLLRIVQIVGFVDRMFGVLQRLFVIYVCAVEHVVFRQSSSGCFVSVVMFYTLRPNIARHMSSSPSFLRECCVMSVLMIGLYSIGGSLLMVISVRSVSGMVIVAFRCL